MTTRSPRARLGGGLATLLLVAATTGCGSTTEPGTTTPTRVEIPAASIDAVALSEQGAWWSEDVLHLGDATIEVGRIRSFAVADRTVTYVSRGGRLCFTDLTDRACSGFRPSGDLVVSPDGAHLGFLDSAFGETDRYDTSLLTATVLDLSTGRVVASSTAGMGDVADDDLADLYEDAWPYFSGFDDTGAALVFGADNDAYTLPLDGSEVRPLPVNPAAIGSELPGQVLRDVPGEIVTAPKGATVTIRPGAPNDSSREGRLSPDGSQVLVTGPGGSNVFNVATAPTGTRTPLTGQEGGWYAFGPWTGPHEFLATTLSADQTAYRLYRCDAQQRTCTLEQDLTVGKEGTDAVLFPTTAGSDMASITDY